MQPMQTLTVDSERLLPILVYIQTYLDEDLSLGHMAQRAGLSPFHFHRVFRDLIGETLKQYTQRLRLERAAYQLRIRHASILDIALSAGFRTHETFTRAFKRRFKTTPQKFRQAHGRFAIQDNQHATRQPLNKYTQKYQISKVTTQALRPISVAFIRNLGSYLDVDVQSYDILIAWAKSKQLYREDNLLIGIGHDDPNITPVDKLRYDACLQIPGPIKPEGNIGYQTIPAGYYGVMSYVGPYGVTMLEAYHDMFRQLLQKKEYDIIGLPAT